jgi:hypothetical protein
MGMLAEELQLAGLVRGEELLKHQPAEYDSATDASFFVNEDALK